MYGGREDKVSSELQLLPLNFQREEMAEMGLRITQREKRERKLRKRTRSDFRNFKSIRGKMASETLKRELDYCDLHDMHLLEINKI